MPNSPIESHDSRATPSPNNIDSQPTPPWPSRVIGAALFLWIVGVTTLSQTIAWIARQLSMRGAPGGLTDPDFIATVVQGILLLLPLAPLALAWKQPSYRLIFRLWALAALFGLLASVVHLPGATQGYLSIGLQIAVALIFAIALALIGRRAPNYEAGESGRYSSLALALVLTPFLLAPWVISGAFGGPLEAVLNLIAALLFGLCSALLLRRLSALAPVKTGLDNRLRALGGFVAGAILLPMSASYGFGGNQLLMLLAVPAVGWLAVTMLGRRREAIGLTLLVGLSAAGPLLFVDPREMALAISFGLFSTLAAAFRAAVIAMLLAWIAGGFFLSWRWLGRRQGYADKPRSNAPAWTTALAALPAWLALVLAYTFLGNSGFYGDRLFVVMDDQADVSAAQQLGDVSGRRAFVYETLTTHAEETQDDIRADLARWGIAYTPYYLVNGLEVEGGPIVRTWLESRPDVDRVLYSPILRPAPPEEMEQATVAAPTEPPWNVSFTGADAVWRDFGVRGAGVVIGQSDSGVQWDHPELLDAYRGGADEHDYNWYDPWNHTQQPVDTSGHGTHTLGTVLGNVTGIAPDASWFGCANLARNVGSTPYYLDCLQFMLAPFPLGGDPFADGDASLGANVLNNSWGCPDLEGCDDESLLPAVTAMRHAGTFVVVSGGNEGPACSSLDSPPAIYDQVLSVGAVDRSGNITFFSSRGPVTIDGSNRTKPDLVAPGFDIVSAMPQDDYRAWQGTSMAGPHVAGVVALMWSANPDLIGDIERTEQILIDSAQPPPVQTSSCSDDNTLPNNTFGYGLVDAYAAVQEAMALSGN
ncbi:MAG: S8 family serine peptidase [Chloroflexota bacterium]